MTDSKSLTLTGLQIYKGNLTYVLNAEEANFDSIDIVPSSARSNRTDRDGESYHITIVTKSESRIPEDKVELLREKYKWSQFATIGIGSVSKGQSKAYYQIVWYPAAHKIRELLKLPPKDFHITLGFEHSDVHDTTKNSTTLIALNPNLLESIKPIIRALPKYQLIELSGLLDGYDDDDKTSTDLIELKIKTNFLLKNFDTCFDLLTELESINYDDHRYIVFTKAYIYLQMNQIFNAIHCLNQIPEDDRDSDWNALISDAKYRSVRKADTRVKRSIHVGDREIKLSRNFSWLIPLKIAGISIPKTADQISAFEYANIGLVVTVMEEQSLPAKWFEATSVDYAYYAVENYGAPTMDEMDEIIQKMENMIRQGRGVIVHCGGGKGRAGTVLSCFVAKNGIDGDIKPYPQMGAQDAITYVREMRPGSVESKKQDKFISDYVNHLYKQQSK